MLDNCGSLGYTSDLQMAAYETLFCNKVKDPFKLSSTPEKCYLECLLPSVIMLSLNNCLVTEKIS